MSTAEDLHVFRAIGQSTKVEVLELAPHAVHTVMPASEGTLVIFS